MKLLKITKLQSLMDSLAQKAVGADDPARLKAIVDFAYHNDNDWEAIRKHVESSQKGSTHVQDFLHASQLLSEIGVPDLYLATIIQMDTHERTYSLNYPNTMQWIEYFWYMDNEEAVQRLLARGMVEKREPWLGVFARELLITVIGLVILLFTFRFLLISFGEWLANA